MTTSPLFTCVTEFLVRWFLKSGYDVGDPGSYVVSTVVNGQVTPAVFS